MVGGNMCPVCGFEMEDPPRDYNICPSCGTEFGVHDLNSSIADLRDAWLRTGPRWWSNVDPAPPNWNPFSQFARLLMGNITAGASYSSEPLKGWAGQVGLGLSYDIRPEVVSS